MVFIGHFIKPTWGNLITRACHTAPDVSLLQTTAPGRHQGAIAETNYEINNLGAHVGVSKLFFYCALNWSHRCHLRPCRVSLNCSAVVVVVVVVVLLLTVVMRSGYRCTNMTPALCYRRISRKRFDFKVTVCRFVCKNTAFKHTLSSIVGKENSPFKGVVQTFFKWLVNQQCNGGNFLLTCVDPR